MSLLQSIIDALTGQGRYDGVKLANEQGTVTCQNPLPTNGDSVYEKDLDADNSSSDGFTGGTVADLFNDLDTQIVNSTGDNPKTIILKFNRSVTASGIAVGDTNGGTHSNIKIEAQRGGTTWFTLNDNSASALDLESRFYSFSVSSGNFNIGVVAFTALRITFNTTNTISLSHIIISKTEDRIATLQGLKPDGTTSFIGATNNENLRVSVQEYGDTPAVDAFARLRISEPLTIFDSKQLHDKQPLFWDEELGGSATSTHVPADSDVEMTVTANAADYVIRQTKQRFNYQPGKSQLVLMTFQSPQVAGITGRVGLFDDDGTGNNLTPNNGIFFESDGDVSWNIAKDGTIEETVTQANWNVDKMDGTGKSGITLDLTGCQILVIDFEWLGVGRVRVGFVIDGLIYYVHNFNHANDPTFDRVYMSTPNLPLRYSIETDGTAGSTIRHICSTVISEGGAEETGVLRVVDNDVTPVTLPTASTKYPVVGIKLKAAYKDVTVIPEGLSAICTTNDAFRWSICLNPTLSAPLSYSDLGDSAVQHAVGDGVITATAEGVVISSGYASTTTRTVQQELKTALRIGSTIAGVRDELVLVIAPLSNNAPMLTSLNFRELL